MNVDSLLDISRKLRAIFSDGNSTEGCILEVEDNNERFLFSTSEKCEARAGGALKISDGLDSVVAHILDVSEKGILCELVLFTKPAHERRKDVRIDDKVYIRTKLIASEENKANHGNSPNDRFILLKNLVGTLSPFLSDADNTEVFGDAKSSDNAKLRMLLCEINRKLDIIMYMQLSEEFKELISGTLKEVNISASGLRFVTDIEYGVGDIIEVLMILPSVPVIFVRTTVQVLRTKPLADLNNAKRYSVACIFDSIDDNTKEDIVKYIFMRQRSILRKKLDG